jgi:hypothetical protein
VRLSHDDFLRADDRQPEEVSLDGIPGYDGRTVLVRGLTGAERDQFETSMLVRRGNKLETNWHNLRAKLVALCVVDDDGKPLFDVAETELIGNKSAAVISRIYDTAARLSGLSESDVEELIGNFGGTSSGSSSSGSPSGSGRPSPSSSPAPTPGS